MEKRRISAQDLNRLFFTADQHLGHEKIHRPDYANRPWSNVDEMDKGLIHAWNCKIPDPKSLVIVAGDLCLDSKRAAEYAEQLNGRIIYVLGDHGTVKPGTKGAACFESVHHILRLTMPKDLPDIILSHWAMRKWPRAHYGTWHLFGHSHGEIGPWGLSFDCGVDNNRPDFAPLSYYEVAMLMAGIEESDAFVPAVHHGKRQP